MKLRALLIVGIAIAAFAQLAFSHEGATERFVNAISTTPSSQMLRVTVAFREQLDVNDLLKRVDGLPRRQWRSVTVPIMKEHSALTQSRVRDALNRYEREGVVRNIRIIWLTNEINFEATVGYLNGFFEKFPELRSIDLDPDIPIEQLIDTAPYRIAPPPPAVDSVIWGVRYIGAPQVWAQGFYGQGIIIGNIDTGAERTHPALSPRIWNNTDEIAGNSIDDDGNGYVDDTWGWNFDNNTNNPGAGNSHGTCTSGIMVGASATDSCGVAMRAQLMVLKNETGGEAGYRLASQYAVNNGADVISSSLSYKWPSRPDYQAMRQMTDMELVAGVIHANSIGNQGNQLSTHPIPNNISTPGNCPPPWLHPAQTLVGGVSSTMGCGAFLSTGLFADYTGRGPAQWDSIISDTRPPLPIAYRDYPWRSGTRMGLLKPDISMPTEVRTTTTGGGYTNGFNGTSAATPHLGGALALLLSAAPDATPAQVAEALKMTADTSGIGLQHNLYGAGRARLPNALAYLISMQSVSAIEGIITDTLRHQRLSNVRVDFASRPGFTVTTNDTGWFRMEHVPPSTYELICTKAGYRTARLTGVVVDTADTTRITVQMSGQRFDIAPDTMNFSVVQSEQSIANIRIRNTGIDSIVWNARVRSANTQDTLWGVARTIDVTMNTMDTYILGVEWAYNCFWVSGANQLSNRHYIYQFSREGILLRTIRQPDSTDMYGMRDIAFDGRWIWGNSTGGRLMAIDTNGVEQAGFVTNYSPNRAVAYSPLDSLFYVADNMTSIQVYNRAGAYLRTIPNSSSQRKFGMSWYQDDPDGYRLYIFSQDSTYQTLLGKMNVTTGAYRPVRMLENTSSRLAGGIAIIPRWTIGTVAVAAVLQGASQNDLVRVYNMSANTSWVALDHANGVLREGATDSIRVTVNATDMPVGEFPAIVEVNHSAIEPAGRVYLGIQITPSSAIEQGVAGIPTTFTVSELSPNPFNPTARLQFSLPGSSPVTVTVFDRLGRQVATVSQAQLTAGVHAISIDGSQLSSGMYFYRVETRFGTAFKKGVLLK